ncbi:MAG: type II secretion system GspH family protein [Lentisphaerales bacterium]|nr:type II secretion system GspH family protein [Lentisphaerales bacterium]
MIILKENKRFTVIELLIVISIIGILSTMLLPSLSKARMSALVSLCKSNERQLVFATMNYADDYQDILPTYNKLTA